MAVENSYINALIFLDITNTAVLIVKNLEKYNYNIWKVNYWEFYHICLNAIRIMLFIFTKGNQAGQGCNVAVSDFMKS